MVQYSGQCHCGQTAWTAEIPEERHILCHCGACKLMSGGEFTFNQIVPKENFNLTKGDLKVYSYKGDSGPDKIVIRTGLLKGSEKWGKPAAEIYDKFRAAWLPQTGDASFELGPPS
ncbi:hypothetical protein LTR99_007502 [Exophiala xenobiotica]|uniref:CENP-V/GFA domain-containing protein n=1 Tax=Vermiconidia calcicola TaxID=1690605 RepID=A0AAV9Q6J4_9PEZI|nr:hypothetical protein H2202_010769 [Exophiala xenobiotica]KAK5529910.1 hypothetical protein LTR23_010554 [Chaetothyriales sp. CCFEE 6169]KAK5534611.1 hypothetical protein LTR25_006643 [Vermiconidia calcicola]KAK5198249.1 hypothetical protein LTR92_002494 [Exophiala xenobiotica]KAK5228199.1 hypothetical protein LTR72_002082 [Exophiala xenobiotica]